MNVQPAFLSHRRKPRFKLPPGTCDAHCHVFGPAAKFPYAPNRRYTPEDAPKEMLAALHAHLGIERAVIVQASCHGIDNAAMLDCIASDPTRYRGVAIVNGENDPFVRLSYFEALHYGALWEHCHVVPGVGHAPFWERPDLFNPMLSRFADAVEAQSADGALVGQRRSQAG